jgi:hypothetical protein
MAKQVNVCFEVAPNKRGQFLQDAASSCAFQQAMKRAARNIPDFEQRTVKRYFQENYVGA